MKNGYRWYLLPPLILLNIFAAMSVLPHWYTILIVLGLWAIALFLTVGLTELRKFKPTHPNCNCTIMLADTTGLMNGDHITISSPSGSQEIATISNIDGNEVKIKQMQ